MVEVKKNNKPTLVFEQHAPFLYSFWAALLSSLLHKDFAFHEVKQHFNLS